MENEDKLISTLIEETCSQDLINEEEAPVVDLRRYFEKRLNQVDFISFKDYLNQNQLLNLNLDYGPQTRCLRLKFKQLVLDFPSNWSIFNEIKERDFIYLDESSDNDFLLDIFSEICGSFQNLALVNEEQEIKLVFLPEEESLIHITWIKNYFERKKTEQFFKEQAAG